MFPRNRLVLSAFLLVGLTPAFAQGPPGRDRDNPPPGHGGVPPGQAKKHGEGRNSMPPGQAKKYESGRPLPPGQAKKYFRETDRDYFYSHYRADADHWRGRPRPVFIPGRPIVPGYVIRPVPRGYIEAIVAPPPPPGYQYGYCGGYVVVYNPATRIIADALDLIAAASSR